MSVRFALVATVCVLAQGAGAGPATEHDAPSTEVERHSGTSVFSKPIWRCYGGLEDRKTVVRNADLADDAAQTTRSGCRLGGGAVARAPQSPTISAGRPVVA